MIMNNMFFNFLKPYLSYIDNGDLYRKPIKWLYTIFAVLNLLIPFFMLYMVLESEILGYANAKAIITFTLCWLVVVGVSWFGFQLWWDRRNKIETITTAGDDFIATPAVAHLIQTAGEWFGTWVGVGATLIVLIGAIFMGSGMNDMGRIMGFGVMRWGIAGIIFMPIFGFMIIIGSRFFAEQIRAIAAIANNTKK